MQQKRPRRSQQQSQRQRRRSHNNNAEPSQTPGFAKVQDIWYRKLRATGFKDIEDARVGGFEIAADGSPIGSNSGGRPLKSWSGEHRLRTNIAASEPQAPLEDLITNFPEPVFQREESFTRHPEFIRVCQTICQHRNSKLSYLQVMEIWKHYADGKSYRRIATKYDIHYSQVARLVQKLIEWMDFLGGSMDQEERAVIREYSQSDAAFVFSTWRNALWYDKKDRTEAAGENFYKMVTKRINKMLKRPDATLRIACLSTNRDHIIGCALKIGSCLEWVYVKADYRRQGIGTLLAGQFTEVSKPVTRAGTAIAKKKNLKIKGEMNHEQEAAHTRSSSDSSGPRSEDRDDGNASAA